MAVKREVTAEVALQKQLLQAQKMEAVGTLADQVLGLGPEEHTLYLLPIGIAA